MNVIVDIANDCSGHWTPAAENCLSWITCGLETTGQAHERDKSPSVLAGKDQNVSLRFVAEIESAALNEQYRGKHTSTNVLSFPTNFPESLVEHMEYQCLGDIVVCPAIVEKEAREQRKTLEAHWAHLLIHGVLHLLGYDHVSDQQAHQMENLEIEALETLGFPNPYLIT